MFQDGSAIAAFLAPDPLEYNAGSTDLDQGAQKLTWIPGKAME
jgi:hypothetical protein